MKKLKSSNIKLRPLTKSEKTLLTLLVIALIVYLANRFLLVPQTEKIRSLETEIAELDNQITDMQNMIKKEDTIKKEWEMLHRERDEILKNYFPVLDQAQILYLLNDLISDEMVTISELSFSTPEEETIGEMPVKNMSISVPYRGTYDGTIEVVKALSSSPRRIVVDNLLMEKEATTRFSITMRPALTGTGWRFAPPFT
jgi:Tfp pilus assembly protein PilO